MAQKSQESVLYIVAGAPSAGKTSAVEELLQTNNPEFLVLDIDWLLKPASDLAGKDVVSARESWKPFRQLWIDLITQLAKTHRYIVLFANINKNDVAELSIPDPLKIQWLLLDCSDESRRKRHAERYGHTRGVDEDLDDAKQLRQEVDNVINTDKTSPVDVAKEIQQWIQTGMIQR